MGSPIPILRQEMALLRRPLIYEVPARLAHDWLEFKVTDADMLAEYYAPDDLPPAIFIASLNSANEVRMMLEMCGRFYVEQKVEFTLFRTSHPTVLAWAKRFEAWKHDKENHRPRFMLVTPPGLYYHDKWRALCVHAYRLSSRASSR